MNGLAIAPPYFAQELTHGYSPFYQFGCELNLKSGLGEVYRNLPTNLVTEGIYFSICSMQ